MYHPLERFYYGHVTSIDPKSRFQTFLEIQDVIVINFDCIYERSGNLRATDQIIYLAHKLGKDKRFIFLSEDGASIANSGAIEIITNIIDCFDLTAEQCALICREHITIPNCTVIVKEAIDYWCRVIYPYIKDIQISNGAFTKKFAAWYHRGTFFRFELAKHLMNYQSDSYISYQETGIILDPMLKEYFDVTEMNTPVVYDQIFADRKFDYTLIVSDQRKPYGDYFLEVVAETDILSADWITEKTVKNLYIGKPFLVLSGQGTLERIKSRGFKTFSPWIDESYDAMTNIDDRLSAIKQEIDRLASKSIEELQQMQRDMRPVFEHNRTTYETYINSW